MLNKPYGKDEKQTIPDVEQTLDSKFNFITKCFYDNKVSVDRYTKLPFHEHIQ